MKRLTGSIPLLVTLSLVLYAVSFFLPVKVNGQALYGFEVFAATIGFAISPGDVLSGPSFMALWGANPIFWLGLGLLCFRERWLACFAAVMAMLFGATGAPLLEGLSPGYWVWQAAFATLAVGSLAGALAERRAMQPGNRHEGIGLREGFLTGSATADGKHSPPPAPAASDVRIRPDPTA